MRIEPGSTPCTTAGTDPDAYFPRRKPSEQAIEELCGGCRLAAECHAYAVRHRLVGVWGGRWRRGDR